MPLQFHLKIQKLLVQQASQLDQSIFFKFNIDGIQFSSGESKLQNKYFWFMENNLLQTESDSCDSKLFAIQVLEHNQVIGNKTFFIKDAITKEKALKQIQINCSHFGKGILFFSLKVIDKDKEFQNLMKKNIISSETNQEEIDKQTLTLLSSQSKKVQILNMGVLMYNFTQRLDQVVWLSNELVSFLIWENQIKTIVIGLILTIIILNLTTSLFLAGLSFLISRKYIIQFYQNLRPINVSQRVVAPKENILLLQEGMNYFCQVYQQIYNIISNDDRSKVIAYIDRLCLFGFFTLLCLIVFSFDTLVIIGLWLILTLTSPWGKNFKKALLPIIKFSNEILHNITQRAFSKTKTFISYSKQMEILSKIIEKQFYIYQYQRWWITKNWIQSQTNKWSDQTWNASTFPRNNPPKDWNWIQQWKIVVSAETDENGYQYANDFTKQWNNEKALKTLRRRVWQRKCQIKIKQ